MLTMFVPLMDSCRTCNPVSCFGNKVSVAPAAVVLLLFIESLDGGISELVGGSRLKKFYRISMFSRAWIPFLCLSTVINGRDGRKDREPPVLLSELVIKD